jgi:V8-like Glu-specific endopeptidase
VKKKVFLSIFVLLLFSISLPAQAIEGGNLAPGKNVVSIFLKMPDGSTGKCSGAVIYKYLILTAKHCLGITSSNLNGSGIGATVYYPGADTSKINAEKAMVLDVITTTGLQAGAGEGQIGIDIAFLIIDKNFPIPTNQQLATSELIQNWKLNSQSVYSYGYGVQANGNSLSIPKRMLQNFSPTTDVSTNQLTLKHPTRDTFICGGDSGGPTYVEQNGVEYLIGPMSGTTLDSCKRDSLQIPATTLVTSLVNFNDLYERAKIRVAKFQPNLRQQITCVKGKLSKIVTGVNPKCPRGYKKKILDKPATNVIVRYPEALSVQKILDLSNFKNLNQQITAQWFFEDKNDVNAVYWTKLGLENALKLLKSDHSLHIFIPRPPHL